MIDETPNPFIELTSSGKLACLQPQLMSAVRTQRQQADGVET
jgi:hypothetical protein